jgi:hypothetical protein
MESGDQIAVKIALRKNQIDFLTGFSASQRAATRLLRNPHSEL